MQNKGVQKTMSTIPNRPQWLWAFCQFSVRTFRVEVKGKGKAVSLQAWSGPEGFRNLRFPDFMTTAQDGGKVASLTHRPPLPTGNTPGTHFC